MERRICISVLETLRRILRGNSNPMSRFPKLISLVCYILVAFVSFGQDVSDSLIARVKVESYLNAVSRKYSSEIERITSRSRHYIGRLEQLEESVFNSIDPHVSKLVSEKPDTKGFYRRLMAQATSVESSLNLTAYQGKYFPYLDSIETSLRFLMSRNSFTENPEILEKLKTGEHNLQILYAKISNLDEIEKRLQSRRQWLTNQLENVTKGSLKRLKKYQKELQYYNSQIAEIKNELDQPDKLIKRGLSIMRRSGLFEKFFNKYSVYASFFGSVETDGDFDPSAFPNLQTRASMERQIKERFGGAVSASTVSGQGALAAVQAELGKLKASLWEKGVGSSQQPIPEFESNSMRTKSFGKRLEYGISFQSVRTNGLFPATTDIALTLGYRISDKMKSGIGLAYKVGWGSGFKDIKITHQGFGLRYFFDYAIIRSVYVSAGGEFNYRSIVNSFSQLRDINAWQKSGLIGVSKEYMVGKSRKGQVQLYYDFMHNLQVPRTQPLLFRMGYIF